MLPMRRAFVTFWSTLAVTLLAMAAPAFAIATLEVTVTDGTNGLPGETISLFTETGTPVKQAEKKDATTSFEGLEPGIYTIKSGDETVRTVRITEEDTIKRVSVMAPAALIRAPNFANMNGLGFGLRGFGKFGDFDGDLNSNVPGSASGDAQIRDIGFAADIFYRPPNLADLFFVASFALLPSADDRTAFLDLHPTPGLDTSLKFEEEYYARVMLGWTFFQSNLLSFDALAGIQATKAELTLSTDESGGGGVQENFTQDEFLFGPVVGLQGRYRLPNARNVSLYGGVTTTYQESIDVRGRSGVGFDYDGDIDRGFQTELSLGLLFNF